MESRPSDFWPRGDGHVILGVPGSREQDKGYHEPGGSFSPGVGSFGIAVWVVDRSGHPVASGDSLPLAAIRQRFARSGGVGIPGIETETEFYRACWAVERPGRWRLVLHPAAGSPHRLALVVRSGGPAGGPVTSLAREGRRLLVNGRWTVASMPEPVTVHLGEEGREGWMHERAEYGRWAGDGGWGYARLELASSPQTVVEVEGPAGDSAPDLEAAACRPPLRVDVPDERFTACLKAQIVHLMMGLVDRETRPGDPVNYPLPWLRDGAHVLAALAGAGSAGAARLLAGKFANEDFFGGFGAEGDGPGLAIWALDEAGCRLRDPEFDRETWPHVRRKAGLILEMIDATGPVRKPYTGPIVPVHRDRPDLDLVAEAASNGLVRGRMDNHFPVLFVNAACFAGLVRAANLARRIGEGADADRWGQAAARLAAAWERCLGTPEAGNERTFIFGLWPSGVAEDCRGAYRRLLDERWDRIRTREGGFREPRLWTYFDFAEAHQWLWLGEADRARRTLDWYLDRQASPGLYSWWEGDGEENTFHKWEEVRGWTAPKHVTPHYWTAAQALLLQLDMLAYSRPGAGGPVITVGAGASQEWLGRPHGVERLATAAGEVDWRWESGRMRVRVRGASGGSRPSVRLGGAYPAEAKVDVEYGE